MEIAEFLTYEEMSAERAPAELYRWVMMKCEKLGASREAKIYANSGALLPKKFYDEIFPIAVFVKKDFAGRGDVRVRPNLGNENYDAVITVGDGKSSESIFVEITYAKDGYDDSLRMEYLMKYGHVPLTGPVSSTGRRGASNRRVSVEIEAKSHKGMLEKQSEMILDRIRKKLERNTVDLICCWSRLKTTFVSVSRKIANI